MQPVLSRALLGYDILAGKHFTDLHPLNSLLPSSLVRIISRPIKNHVSHPRWSEHGRVFHFRSIIMVAN